MTIREQSVWMKLMLTLGLESVAWSFRRLHCPVDRDALVLEVGSGGNPYFRANVLLDAYEVTRERHWEPLITDRPTVLGFVECLPFKDKVFDFVIASHVLEHSKHPDAFLNELQRVAKAGYIEVPDAFMERINPYLDHRLEITVRDKVLLISKKGNYQVDEELVELYSDKAKTVVSGETMRRHPFHFHVRYYWQDHINFRVLNPAVDADWSVPESSEIARPSLISLKRQILKFTRFGFSQKKRNRSIDLKELLICIHCKSDQLKWKSHIECADCGATFSMIGTIPDMAARKE